MRTFADLTPGAALGECAFAFTQETTAEWTALFPDDRGCLPAMPPAMIAMVVMRAFITLMPDRPAGNVHAGQKFWISRLPTLDERLTTRLSCAGKELKRGRQWVTFATDTVDAAGHSLFRGQSSSVVSMSIAMRSGATPTSPGTTTRSISITNLPPGPPWAA